MTSVLQSRRGGLMTSKTEARQTRTGRREEASTKRNPDPAPPRPKRYNSRRSSAGSSSGSTEVAQVRLRPDEMADLRHVMETLQLGSLSDALREGLRLLSREAAEMAAAEEIRAFYKGQPVPTPAGVLPISTEELEAADDTEW
jgi:hypothetical protein